MSQDPNINPNLKHKGPIRVELKAGQKISWCTCGYSAKDPFCDGAHRECPTMLRSFKFESDQDKTVALCGCKRTGNPPFCDGSHVNPAN